MEWLYSLFFGSGIAHAVLIFALVITVGILLGKVKIGGVSLGITWILFVGILFSHFGMTVDGEVRHFVQEFGLILFVFSIGLQVGPGFFASFKHGGMTLVGCAVAIVLLGVVTAYVLHAATGTPIPTMVGILSGAVTNTPGLGAAQQAYADATGCNDPSIALGYAVAYPLGVVGIIFTMIFVRYVFRVKFEKEDEALAELAHEQKFADKVSVEFTNGMLDGRTVEMVVMRMGDEHRIGFRQMRVIGILADRIDIDAPPVEIDGQRSVFEKREDDRPPVAGRHRIGRIDRRLLLLEQRDHNLPILGDSGRRYEKSRAEANLFALCRDEISEVRPKASEFRETDPPHPRFSPAGSLRRKARSRNSAPCAPALRSEWGRRLLPVTYDQHLRRTPKPFGIGNDQLIHHLVGIRNQFIRIGGMRPG